MGYWCERSAAYARNGQEENRAPSPNMPVANTRQNENTQRCAGGKANAKRTSLDGALQVVSATAVLIVRAIGSVVAAHTGQRHNPQPHEHDPEEFHML